MFSGRRGQGVGGRKQTRLLKIKSCNFVVWIDFWWASILSPPGPGIFWGKSLKSVFLGLWTQAWLSPTPNLPWLLRSLRWRAIFFVPISFSSLAKFSLLVRGGVPLIASSVLWEIRTVSETIGFSTAQLLPQRDFGKYLNHIWSLLSGQFCDPCEDSPPSLSFSSSSSLHVGPSWWSLCRSEDIFLDIQALYLPHPGDLFLRTSHTLNFLIPDEGHGSPRFSGAPSSSQLWGKRREE